jgi:hypothetical protein
VSERARPALVGTGIAIALLLASIPAPATAVTLARGGRTSLSVVLADDAIPAERTAAQELIAYLERVTSASFPLVPESRAGDGAPAIWVGPTGRSRDIGIDADALEPEQWVIRTAGEDLVLVGGRPRGTLYAVYHFLEDHVGVHWWTPFEEHVPIRTDLEVEADATGRPAFSYRDIHGVPGPSVFHARNRANGHYSFLTAAYGGNEGYGPPAMVHTFFMYVPPKEYFATHPEFFSERDGKRVGKRAQLCLTNDALLELVAGKLDAYVEQARVEAEAKGERPPRLFSFSQNDWRRPCTCKPCREVDTREGSHSGSLVHFINRLADSIAEKHPDVLLDTLAYDYTLRPPREARLRDNVVVRLADLQYRDFSRPVTHRANREVRRAIEGWSRATRHLRIWCYTVTFGRRANNLPLPNLGVIAADFRYYLAQGVEGLFIQHSHPVLADMRDLKQWIVFKLAEDPMRDLDALVAEFTDGFYGPAGETIREYLRMLERQARHKRSPIRFPTDYEQYRYLTPAFLRRAQSLFDRAERQAAGEPVLLRRLRHARLSLDRATLLRWDDAMAAPARRSDAGPPIDPGTVAGRYGDTAHEQIEIRIRPGRRDKLRDQVDREIADLLARIGG